MNGMFYRGEIYFVLPEGNEVGSEKRSNRPGIIVSSDTNNKFSTTVQVVYLTTKEKKSLATHVHIETAKLPSTALCEQIFTVDKLRMDSYVGKLTPKEMEEVERSVMIALGLDNYLSKPKTETPDSPAAVQPPLPADVVKSFSWEDKKRDNAQPAGGLASPELIRAYAQRDAYKELLTGILERRRA